MRLRHTIFSDQMNEPNSLQTLPFPSERWEFLAQLAIYLEAHYPGCPARWRRKLLTQARLKGHKGRLGQIAGILVHNFIRHQKTDYERLMRNRGKRRGLTREEARLVVAQEVEDLFVQWRQGSPEADPAYQEFMERLRGRRDANGAGRNSTATITAENDQVADYLAGWLGRQGRVPWWWGHRHLTLRTAAPREQNATQAPNRGKPQKPVVNEWWDRTAVQNFVEG